MTGDRAKVLLFIAVIAVWGCRANVCTSVGTGNWDDLSVRDRPCAHCPCSPWDMLCGVQAWDGGCSGIPLAGAQVTILVGHDVRAQACAVPPCPSRLRLTFVVHRSRSTASRSPSRWTRSPLTAAARSRSRSSPNWYRSRCRFVRALFQAGAQRSAVPCHAVSSVLLTPFHALCAVPCYACARPYHCAPAAHRETRLLRRFSAVRAAIAHCCLLAFRIPRTRRMCCR